MNDEEPTEAKPSRELFGSGWVEDKTECDQNDEWRKAVLRWRDECWLQDWEFDIEMEEEPSHDREGEGYQLGASTDII
ncbi:hypothetical protein LCGC14_1235510, partial [marine sediment metagenome]